MSGSGAGGQNIVPKQIGSKSKNVEVAPDLDPYFSKAALGLTFLNWDWELVVDMLHQKRPDKKSKQTDLAPELGPHLPSEHQSLDIQPHNKINQQPIHANPQPSQPTAKPR